MLVAPETTKIKKNTSRCSSFPLSVHCWQYSHKKGEINVLQFACAYPTGQAKRDHLSILKSLSLPPDPPLNPTKKSPGTIIPSPSGPGPD